MIEFQPDPRPPCRKCGRNYYVWCASRGAGCSCCLSWSAIPQGGGLSWHGGAEGGPLTWRGRLWFRIVARARRLWKWVRGKR